MDNKHSNSDKTADVIETYIDENNDVNRESDTDKVDGAINTSNPPTDESLINPYGNQALTEIDWQRSEDGNYSPSSYINRDLSLLQFHLRVLAQAADPHHPLLERLFFLMIFSSSKILKL